MSFICARRRLHEQFWPPSPFTPIKNTFSCVKDTGENAIILNVFIKKDGNFFSNLHSWWTIARHLIWSLLGIVELDPMESMDKPSVTVGYALYGAFLIMGVILLINMMIALLSNTYTRVQVRYFALFSGLAPPQQKSFVIESVRRVRHPLCFIWRGLFVCLDGCSFSYFAGPMFVCLFETRMS